MMQSTGAVRPEIDADEDQIMRTSWGHAASTRLCLRVGIRGVDLFGGDDILAIRPIGGRPFFAPHDGSRSLSHSLRCVAPGSVVAELAAKLTVCWMTLVGLSVDRLARHGHTTGHAYTRLQRAARQAYRSTLPRARAGVRQLRD